jgi:hypothetical protein
MNNLIKTGDSFQNGRFVVDSILGNSTRSVSDQLIASDKTLKIK